MATYSLAELERSGIYQIVNKVNGKRYVGSAVCIRKRWHAHRCGFRLSKHPNRYLMSSWQKYGEEAFTFEILEHCSLDELLVREQWWIDSTSPEYNLSPTAGSCRGVKHTEEVRRRVSERNKGNKYALGRKISEYVKSRVAEANRLRKGVKQSADHAEKRAAGHRGMKRSAETRRRISEAMTGKKRGPRSAEYREKISASMRGRVLSDEHMAALQAGRAKRVYTPEQRAVLADHMRKSYENGTRSREKPEEQRSKAGRLYAKLSDAQVRKIRSLRAEGLTCKALAQQFGSNAGTICEICTGKRYRWVPFE